jgi:transposase
MDLSPDDLPDDIEELKALLLNTRAQTDAARAKLNALAAEHEELNAQLLRARAQAEAAEAERVVLAAEVDRLTQQNARLDHIVKVLRRAQFGRKSERFSPEQMQLALEDVETAFGVEDSAAEKKSEIVRREAFKSRHANRGHLPLHLPREEIVIEPEAKSCPCCGGELHVIGEDVSERLDKIPARLRVLVTRRPKYACRSCTEGVVQAAAPNRLIPGGLPTEALVAHVLESKYANHLPSTGRRRSLRAKGSSSIAGRSPTGSASPPPSSSPCTHGSCKSSRARASSSRTRRAARCSIRGAVARRRAFSG